MMKTSQDKKQAALQIEKELLKELLRVCEENDIPCSIGGGTLLGAVRHKGFIPWDDDIDVNMLREDYNRFVKIAPMLFHKPFFFQSVETDNEYYRAHVQLRYDGTSGFLPEELENGARFHQGIFIDIFPLDIVPNDKLMKRIKWLKIAFWRKVINLIYGRRYFGNTKKKVAKKLAYKYLSPIFSIEFLQRRLQKALTWCNEGVEVASWCINRTSSENCMNKEWFYEFVYIQFEDMVVPAPKEYEKVLESRYDKNYMIPKQVPSFHGEVVLDAEKSYLDFIRGVY